MMRHLAPLETGAHSNELLQHQNVDFHLHREYIHSRKNNLAAPLHVSDSRKDHRSPDLPVGRCANLFSGPPNPALEKEVPLRPLTKFSPFGLRTQIHLKLLQTPLARTP
jgi:hypothetical protein